MKRKENIVTGKKNVSILFINRCFTTLITYRGSKNFCLPFSNFLSDELISSRTTCPLSGYASHLQYFRQTVNKDRNFYPSASWWRLNLQEQHPADNQQNTIDAEDHEGMRFNEAKQKFYAQNGYHEGRNESHQQILQFAR